MYFTNGFVCGGKPKGSIKVKSVKALDNMTMLITFNNDEERLFDATVLKGPVYELLKNPDIFLKPEIDHGVITWAGGTIDCAPEFMYLHSFEYSRV